MTTDYQPILDAIAPSLAAAVVGVVAAGAAFVGVLVARRAINWVLWQIAGSKSGWVAARRGKYRD